MTTEDNVDKVRLISRSLQKRLGDHVDFSVIAAGVRQQLAAYSDAHIEQFVPLLVEARVYAQLRAISSAAAALR